MWRRSFVRFASSTGTKAAPRRIGSIGRLFPLGGRRRNEALRNPGFGVGDWEFVQNPKPESRIPAWGSPARRYRSKLRAAVNSSIRSATVRGKFITVIELNPGPRRASGFYTTPVLGRSKSIFFLPARGILWQSGCRRERHEDLPNVPSKLSKQLRCLPGRWQSAGRSRDLVGWKCHSREIPPAGQSGAGGYGFCLQGAALGI